MYEVGPRQGPSRAQPKEWGTHTGYRNAFEINRPHRVLRQFLQDCRKSPLVLKFAKMVRFSRDLPHELDQRKVNTGIPCSNSRIFLQPLHRWSAFKNRERRMLRDHNPNTARKPTWLPLPNDVPRTGPSFWHDAVTRFSLRRAFAGSHRIAAVPAIQPLIERQCFQWASGLPKLVEIAVRTAKISPGV